MKSNGSHSKSLRLTCETSEYYLDKEHRDRLNAQFAQEQTLRLLPKPSRQRRPRRWLKIALFSLLMALLLTPFGVVQAQDGPQAIMDGGEDSYHPAIVEYKVGLFHLVREEWELAITRFDEAIRLLPEYAAAFEARGYCYEALSDIERAVADYQQAITLDPTYGPTYKLLADLYYTQGNYVLALENYWMYVSLTGGALDGAARVSTSTKESPEQAG